MKRNQILSVIKSLASSQGFYSKLYRSLKDAEVNNFDAYDSYLSLLEEQNFGDAVDLILFLES